MPWGILEDRHMAHVPGTVILSDPSGIPDEYGHLPQEALKHGKGKFANVILSPQPSDSPNDPLNWPTWKKDVILGIVGLSAGVVGAYGPMLSPGFVEISAQLDVSVEVLSQATAWLTLAIGCSLFLFNPMAKKVGRRPVYIISSIIMFSGSLWGGLSDDFNDFLASRIWSGIGMAPYEVLVQCTIADLYFVHERATRIAVWNMFLLCGISGGGLIAGFIIQGQGWKWTFLWCAIFFGVLLPLVYLFVPETAYNRPRLEHHSADGASSPNMSEGEKTDDAPGTVEQGIENPRPRTSPDTGERVMEARKSYLQTLRIFDGVYTRTPLWKIFLRPVVVFWYPAVLWGLLLYGTTLTWIVVFSVVNASIFTAAPYNFSVSQTGLISVSPFVMSLVGEILSGPLNDWVCVRLAAKNRGIYEPEFRLATMFVPLALGVAGFYGFGATVHYQTHWIGPVLCFGLANMSLAFANSSVFGYVIDAHKDLAEEAFVAINARNFLTFGLTYFVNDWLAKDGVLAVFSVLGSIFVGMNLLAIPLWIYGKRIRGWIARNETLHRFMHED